MISLEGAERQTSLAQAEEPGTHFCLAQLIRRSAIMRRQTMHRIQIESLGSRGQAGCPHVLNHSRTQRCHERVPSRVAGPIGPTPEKYPRQPENTTIPRPYGEAVQSNERL
jgi:hypothetical protein